MFHPIIDFFCHSFKFFIFFFDQCLPATLSMIGSFRSVKSSTILAIIVRTFVFNNVFAQIGLVMLIGLAAKNVILIVEFAKLETEKGKDPVEAAMTAAILRFRPILMTAFSFILGVLPLLVASGAGAEARKVMGMTVFSGMLVATLIGVLVVPALYVIVERYIARPKPAYDAAEGG